MPKSNPLCNNKNHKPCCREKRDKTEQELHDARYPPRKFHPEFSMYLADLWAERAAKCQPL